MKAPTEKFKQKRKLLLVLPVIVVIFGTFIAWSLGLGTAEAQNTTVKQGLNTELPQARLPEKATDKLSLYNQARQDSIDKYRNSSLDPFSGSDTLIPGYHSQDSIAASVGPNLSPPAGNSASSYSTYPDPNEKKVRDRLSRLEKALSEPEPLVGEDPGILRGETVASSNGEISQLQQMMEQLNASGESDGEVQGLNELMEKVLDVQYPQRAQQKLLEQSRKNKGRVYGAAPKQDKVEVGLMAKPGIKDRARLVDSGIISVYEPIPEQAAFYGIDGNSTTDTELASIPAVIHETQTLQSGSTVKLRITEDILVNGKSIPAGSFVFGNCSINGERLQIEIPGIRYGKYLFPVSLSVYDLDGLSGIRVPGTLTREAAKDGAGQVVSSMQFMNMDPSLYAQAAGAGVEVAKGLFSKKTRMIRVTVKAGYPVLLMDAKARQELN